MKKDSQEALVMKKDEDANEDDDDSYGEIEELELADLDEREFKESKVLESKFLCKQFKMDGPPSLDELESEMKKIRDLRETEKANNFFKCQQAKNNLNLYGQNCLGSFNCTELDEYIKIRKREILMHNREMRAQRTKHGEVWITGKPIHWHKEMMSTESAEVKVIMQNKKPVYIHKFMTPKEQLEWFLKHKGSIPGHLMNLARRHNWFEKKRRIRDIKKNKETLQFLQTQTQLNPKTLPKPGETPPEPAADPNEPIDLESEEVLANLRKEKT